jgi:hypothetical protein
VCDAARSLLSAAIVLCALPGALRPSDIARLSPATRAVWARLPHATTTLLRIKLTRDAGTGAIGHGHTSQWRALHGGPGRPAAVPRLRPAQQRPCEAADRRARRTGLQRPRARPQRRAHALQHKPRPPAARTTEAEAQWEDMRQVWRGTHRTVRESVGRHIPSGVLHLPCKPPRSSISCLVGVADSSPTMSARTPTYLSEPSASAAASRPC